MYLLILPTFVTINYSQQFIHFFVCVPFFSRAPSYLTKSSSCLSAHSAIAREHQCRLPLTNFVTCPQVHPCSFIFHSSDHLHAFLCPPSFSLFCIHNKPKKTLPLCIPTDTTFYMHPGMSDH